MDSKSTTVDTSFIYRTNLPYGSDGSTNAVLLLCLNKKKLESQLLSDYGDSHAAAYVLDHKGQIILANGLEENTRLPDLTGQASHFEYAYQGTDMTVFHIKSIYNDWTYVWFLSSNQVYSERNFIVYIIVIILLFVVLLGFGIIITLARKQNKPVNEIVRMLLPQSPDKNRDLQRYGEFDWIKGNIQELMSHEQRLQKQLMNNKDLVRSAMLEKLLEGRFSDEQAAEQALRLIQFSFSQAGYTVIALQIAENVNKVSAVANTQVQHSVLLNFIAGRYPEITAHSVNYQQIVLLCPIDTEDAQQVQIFAAQLSDFVNEKGHTNVMIGVGSVCPDLSGIHRSYRSACFALAKAKTGHGGVVFDLSGDDHNNSLYYPLEIEQRIISLVSMGDDTEIQAVMESVYKQNMANLGQQNDLIMIFLSELVGTLLKAMDVAGLENWPECEAIPKLMQNPRMSPDEIFQCILASYHNLCVQIKHNHRDSTSILIKNVTEYIESFYMDSSLSLSKLADKFNLSEAYLSHVFKERTGENLSNCLERIRINYAHALLTETAMSIDDIAEKVGYNSSDTFRKAFKRFHGITPAMYRSSTKSA
jgi:AraC-like DNA-binding protein/adenylate kinase family enzyme